MHFFSLSEQSEKHHFGKSLRIPFSALYTYLPCIKSDLNRKKMYLRYVMNQVTIWNMFFSRHSNFSRKIWRKFLHKLFTHDFTSILQPKETWNWWFLFLFCLRLFYICPLLHRSDMIYYFQSISSLTRASQTKSRLNLGPYQYTV